MTSRLFFCLVIVVSCLAASGNQPAYAQTAPESKPNAELNRKAQALVSDTVTLSRQLKNRENQVLSRITLAELQWNAQEKLARQLYQEAFETVRRIWSNLDPNDDEGPYTEGELIRLRDRVIQSVARHDPVMARQLFEQMRVAGRPDASNSATEGNARAARNEWADEDKALETTIAVAAAEDNSDEKVRLFKKELDSGSLSQAVSLLDNLAKKDPQKAAGLIEDVVEKFRKIDYQTEPAAVEVATFLLGNVVAALPKHKTELEQQRGQMVVIPVTPEVSRQIIEVLTDAALDSKYGRGKDTLLYFLQTAIEDISEIDPTQADRLKKKFAEHDKQGTANPYTQFQQLAAKHDLAPMLEAARNAPPDMRDMLYSEAAQAAWEQGDRVQAQEIVKKNIGSGFERNRLLRTFRDNTIGELIKNGDLVQARQLIQQTRSSDTRVNQLIRVAEAYVLRHDNKSALEVLVEAQTVMPGKPANSTQLDLEIKLAKAFAAVDLDRSFALMGAAIDQINELSNAAARVSAFMGVMPILKDGEFELQSYGIAGVGTVLSGDIRPLVEADFERTRKVFDRFDRTEFRVSAYLFLAQMILAPEKDCSCSCPNTAANPTKSTPQN
jgi:hypothetical protein